MIARLEEVDTTISDEVDDAVLLCEAARPRTCWEVLEGFRFADATEGVLEDRFDHVQST